MRKLVVFNHVSLDGYFVDIRGDMSWAHGVNQDAEWNAFVAENAGGGGELVLGRVTYEMMAGFWPTPVAIESMPEVAKGMNHLPKVVFSRTLAQVSWSNTTLVKGDLASEMRRRKQASGPTLVVLGSGSIVSQLAAAGLIDEFQLVVNPTVFGAGRTMFEGLEARLALRLMKTRAFANGKVLLCYQPTSGL